MAPELTIPLSIGGVSLAGLLLAEQRQSTFGVWLFKPVAAAAYIWIALVHDATSSAYGVAVLIALLLSWCGDVLLIPKARPAVFRAGILAFLSAHIAFLPPMSMHPLR
ncbi:MAG: lysoplasmalogenase family protein [Chromatiales bacterium]